MAVEAARQHRPDVVLMDLRMPRLNGVDATVEVLRSVEPRPRVLVVTTFETDQDVYRALDAGAAGYLLKDAPEERIISAVRGVVEGATVLDASVARRLLAQWTSTRRFRDRRRRSKRSPRASSTCCGSWRRGCRTRGSPDGSSSARPP